MGGELGVCFKKQTGRLTPRHFIHEVLRHCGLRMWNVVLEYGRLHSNRLYSNKNMKFSYTHRAMLHTFYFEAIEKKNMGRAKAISGVIPLCSLTSVCFTLFFKQFQLASKLWPKVRELYPE